MSALTVVIAPTLASVTRKTAVKEITVETGKRVNTETGIFAGMMEKESGNLPNEDSGQGWNDYDLPIEGYLKNQRGVGQALLRPRLLAPFLKTPEGVANDVSIWPTMGFCKQKKWGKGTCKRTG